MSFLRNPKTDSAKQYKNIKNPNLQQTIREIGTDPIDTVLISTSTMCNICSAFNQRIFSLYGQDARFPKLHAFLYSDTCPVCKNIIHYYRYYPGANNRLEQDILFSNRPFSSLSTAEMSTPAISKQQANENITTIETHQTSEMDVPDWYISISFGKSSSNNYAKAVALAKSAPQYHEQLDDGVLLHQAIYSASPDDFKKYLMLYETVGNWKSSFIMINGKLIDRKVIGKINYCYGDKCRIGNADFCYGASYMTDNPFGCHRIQVSEMNHPWWSFYYQRGNKWHLDKDGLKQRIDSYARIYYLCPCFDYNKILSALNSLPDTLSNIQYNKLCESGFNLHIRIK